MTTKARALSGHVCSSINKAGGAEAPFYVGVVSPIVILFAQFFLSIPSRKAGFLLG